eukprot:8021119-Pyramimonas_sp.AAC.1
MGGWSPTCGMSCSTTGRKPALNFLRKAERHSATWSNTWCVAVIPDCESGELQSSPTVSLARMFA